MSLDDELRRALRAQPPPRGFAERVTARATTAATSGPAEAGPPPVAGSRAPGGVGGWLAAAAAVALMAVGGSVYYRQQSATVEAERAARVEGERAARELRIALQLASDKLDFASRRLNREAPPMSEEGVR
jgi:hypothetical protein